MGIFSNLFGNSTNELEKYLEDFHYESLQGAATRDKVREAIKACKRASKAAKMFDLPERFGDKIISEFHAGVERPVILKAKSGGATEEDIREWWNLHDLERRMIKWEDDVARLAAYMSLRDDLKLSEAEAEKKLRKSFPMYGDPTDQTRVQAADRPLPDELHIVVNEHAFELLSPLLKPEIEKFVTMNAFLRHYLNR